MASKNDGTSIVFVIIFIVLYPFIWLYDQLGALLFWSLVGCLCFGVSGYIAKRKKIKSAELAQRQIQFEVEYAQLQEEFINYFEKVAWDTVDLPSPHPDVSREINLFFMRSDFSVPNGHASCIRELQILKESLEIVIKTPNRDTAESRLQLAYKCFSTFRSMKGLFTNQSFDLINQRVEFIFLEAHSTVYVNIANRHLKKRDDAKTEKTKDKYLQLAIGVLNEGLTDPLADQQAIQECLDELIQQSL